MGSEMCIRDRSQAFVSHPFRRCKYQWGKCALLYFCDARVVFALLFIFMNPVDLLGAKISIRVRIGMTHPKNNNDNNNNNNNIRIIQGFFIRIKKDFLKHKTVKTNNKIRCFELFMTPLSRKILKYTAKATIRPSNTHNQLPI